MTKTIALLVLFLMTSSPAVHPPQHDWTAKSATVIAISNTNR
jgi:hypothetical protein